MVRNYACHVIRVYKNSVIQDYKPLGCMCTHEEDVFTQNFYKFYKFLYKIFYLSETQIFSPWPQGTINDCNKQGSR